MPAATASLADATRTDFPNKDESVHSQAQCKPMPLPALGTQKIIQGNGTNVGTVISLQCPDKHKLVGKDFTCVMDTNSTYWIGGNSYCKPMSPLDDYGFRVAVLASIVSSAIILFMSVAFITSCLVDCTKEKKGKREEGESDGWRREELPQHQEVSGYRSAHKGRNNNNSNALEKMQPLWDTGTPLQCGDMQPCRCHQQRSHAPHAYMYGPLTSLAPLPGHYYNQPPLCRSSDFYPLQYSGPLLPSSALTCSDPIQIPETGPSLVWHYGEHVNSASTANTPSSGVPAMEDPNFIRQSKTNKFSVRVISV